MTFALVFKWFIKRKMGNSTARSFAELEIVSNWLQKQTNRCNYNVHQIHVLNAIQAREAKEKMLLIWGRSNGGSVGGKCEGEARDLISNITVSEGKNVLLTQA